MTHAKLRVWLNKKVTHKKCLSNKFTNLIIRKVQFFERQKSHCQNQ